MLAEQFPPQRRGFAIAAHIAGGNLGTIAVPFLGAWLIAGVGWRWTVVLFGIPAILVALGLYALIRESGADRAAARAHGTVRDAFRVVLKDRDLRWIYVSAVLGGGGRGLGVVTFFSVLYLGEVLRLDALTSGLMYTVLVIGSVPSPLVAGWLSDRYGRKPLIIGVYVAGAIAFGVFMLAGSNLALLWLGIILMSSFTFVESPQLQAFMADVAPAPIRDAAFATYFTLAFGVGSLWTIGYGALIDTLGTSTGVPLVFGIMAASFLAAAFAVLPIDPARAARGAAD
jgi:MFS family permease